MIAWAHHGSLSREMRLVVEQRLKRGELAAIVATSSLELGIDIGALDEVVLVGSPFTVGSAVQRLGRSGHRVGAASRAVLFPLHGRDLVDAAVLARCVVEGDIEESVPVVSPLDVLAQVIVSMTGVETWRVDELYDAVRASLPFHALPRQQFDLVLAMLAGRYADTRLRELEPMVAVDAIGGTVQARSGALRRLYANGGTIPDRGYFSLRTADSGALLGELDEEFVWERSVGDTFVFGTQGWRIHRISHQDVEVVPAEGRSGMSPFWKAEEVNRRPHLALRVASALESWNDRLGDPALRRELVQVNRLEPGAADALVEFLRRQREATGRDLPHRHHVLVEHVHDRLRRPRGLHRGGPHPVGRRDQQAVRPGAAGRVAGALRLGARALPGQRRAPPVPARGHRRPGAARSRRAGEPRAVPPERPRGERILRRPVPRERGTGAPAAENERGAAHAALAHAPAGEEPVRGRRALRGLPHAPRDVADLPAGRVRPRQPRPAPRRDGLGRDPRGRVLDPRAVAVLLGRAVARDQLADVRGRHAARVRRHRAQRRPGARAGAVRGPAAARGPVARRRARRPARPDRRGVVAPRQRGAARVAQGADRHPRGGVGRAARGLRAGPRDCPRGAPRGSRGQDRRAHASAPRAPASPWSWRGKCCRGSSARSSARATSWPRSSRNGCARAGRSSRPSWPACSASRCSASRRCSATWSRKRRWSSTGSCPAATRCRSATGRTSSACSGWRARGPGPVSSRCPWTGCPCSSPVGRG